MNQSQMSTFKFAVHLPKVLAWVDESGDTVQIDRENFYEWIWGQFSEEGLLGVHEGTLLSEEAAQQGLEGEAWAVDGGEAPRDRDWVAKQAELNAELYFSSHSEAVYAASRLSRFPGMTIGPIEEQKPQDWDAEWKASFLNAGDGVVIPPFWRVVPPWVSKPEENEKFLKINPGAGFGTGTHEATQLCLQAIGEYSLRHDLRSQTALDFGSGSGILAIGLARLGAQVEAVEIDSLAIDNATENAQLNQVENQVRLSSHLPQSSAVYRVVVANILRPILLEFTEILCQKLDAQGTLILSGLIDTDVDSMIRTYSAHLGMPVTRVLEKGEWRAVVFER